MAQFHLRLDDYPLLVSVFGNKYLISDQDRVELTAPAFSNTESLFLQGNQFTGAVPTEMCPLHAMSDTVSLPMFDVWNFCSCCGGPPG